MVGPREVLGYLNFDIAKIALSSLALSLPFIRIFGFGCPRRTTFQPAVPIVGQKWLALVFLRGTVRIYVVYMREICRKPAQYLPFSPCNFLQQNVDLSY
jgi:hypothetical protein